jgi:lipopolysaccharide transport system ATP-binding protein
MNRAILVSNLSKRYRLGLKDRESETLAGQIFQAIKSPWKNFKRLRDLSRFGIQDESVFWALKDISFEVKKGEVLGIIGKNGAGKSTLLKILSQITEPTSGKIEIYGRIASLLEVGTGFHPELSGRENIYMNGTILGMTRREIDSKLDEIIDFSGVEKFIDTPVKFYSSGMKVRLGFSVAAHLEPEILIVDEVLAVGDFEFQKKCLGKMEDVSKNQGRTVLFVSHNLGAVSSLTTNCLVLSQGILSIFGKTSDAIESYMKLNITGKNYLAENESINLIEFRILNYKSEVVSAFAHDQDLNFILKLKVNVDLYNIILSITVHSIDGEKLSTIHVKPLSFKIGEINVSFLIPGNTIVTGNYYFNLHIHDSYSDYLIIERVVDFEVYDNGSPFFQWNGVDIGKFYLNYKDLKISYV